jgi:hypothetical protein
MFLSRSRKTKFLTTVILVVSRGLKFEPEADIGRKDRFRSGTILEFINLTCGNMYAD